MLSAPILKEIDRIVDSEEFLAMARKSAHAAHHTFKEEKGRTQIRNLQNVVNSTSRFSEITNFVKAQTGRHKDWKNLGPQMIDNLTKIDSYATTIQGKSNGDQGDIRLRLCRHWVKIVVAEFLYAYVDRS